MWVALTPRAGARLRAAESALTRICRFVSAPVSVSEAGSARRWIALLLSAGESTSPVEKARLGSLIIPGFIFRVADKNIFPPIFSTMSGVRTSEAEIARKCFVQNVIADAIVNPALIARNRRIESVVTGVSVSEAEIALEGSRITAGVSVSPADKAREGSFRIAGVSKSEAEIARGS